MKTGSGYLSFSIAQKYSNISIIGLDIVEKALEVNCCKAKEENIRNISFITYDGMDWNSRNLLIVQFGFQRKKIQPMELMNY